VANWRWWLDGGPEQERAITHHNAVRGGRSTEINFLETLNDDNLM
jgi:hypothetical protein